MNATPTPQPPQSQPPRMAQPQPFATWNPTDGVWETSQLDLFGHSEPFSAIWPTCGSMRDGSAYRRPASALPTTGSASSSSPTARTLFRTPLATDSSRGGETLDQVRARRGTIALSHQIIDFALHGPDGSANKRNEPETLFVQIENIFDAGGRYAHAIARWEHITGREAPSPALLNDETGPRPAPAFIEWLMGQ